MKQKLLSLLTLLLCVCATAWAETAVICNGNMTSQDADDNRAAGNLWIGNGTALNSGFSVQITGNLNKALTAQSTVKVGSTSYGSFKNSNGAQNTITLPTGYKAKSVTFYVTANADADAKLQEFEGESLGENADAVTSHKDGDNPTVIAKTLNNPANAFTFTFGTKQVFFVAVVEYQLPQPDITTQPVSASYQKDATATALAVVATASKGNLAYQWYSCDDAQKTNATAIDGQIDASYIPSTATVGTFYYFCRVTDDNGTTDSKVATITVANAYAPIVTTTKTSVEVLQYETATLGVTVDAIPAATIQWYSCDDADKTNAAAIDGATNENYSPSTDNVGKYYFYAVATNAQGATSSNVVTLTVNKDVTGTAFYSWDKGTETGGEAVASDEESVGYNSQIGAYTSTIRLNGKSDFSSNTITITLDHALKTGDQIRVTAFRYKNEAGKQGGFKAKFEKGSNNVASSTGLEFVNLNAAVEGTDEYGTEPNTCVFSVPASAAGSKTITMTRSHQTTNLFITKLEVYRPAIALNAVLNAAGLLTADEISNTANFSFGVTSNNERVATDAANAVVTMTGKYHNDHGCTGLNVVAKVPGAVKITIGQCTYSKSQVTVKNSNGEDVVLFKPNSPACWKNSTANVDVFYYAGGANTLTISGMTYCPFVAIEEMDINDAVVSITPAHNKTTYVTTMPLDFTKVEGLTSNVATAAEAGKVTLTPVQTVPAGTPLLLEGTANTKYTIPVTASAVAPNKNMFVAGDGEETTFNGSTFDYILYSDGKFYQIGSGTVATTKAYLHCESDPTGKSSARGLSVTYEDVELTGITNVNSSDNANSGVYYNLNGQRIGKPAKGMYIFNGKKYIAK